MKRLSYLLVFSFLFVLNIVLTVDAQSSCIDPATGGAIPCPTDVPEESGSSNIPDADGDGTSDSIDQCPNAGGPSWNSGCPSEPDADGDGTPDSSDECPNEGGPDWNNGCPSDDESAPGNTENFPALPQFPLDPDAIDENGWSVPCYVATLTNTPVNLREETNINSPVESILDPYEPEFALYRHVTIRGGIVEEWYKTLRGYAAAWVTRISPQCEDSMSTWYFNYTDNSMSVVVEGLDLSGYNPEKIIEQNAVILICPDYHVVLLPDDALTDCSGNGVSPSPNGERFLCDDTWVAAFNDCTFPSLTAVLISASAELLSISLAPSGTPLEEAPPPDEGQITLLFGNSIDELMFNPQPEPPADEDGLFVILSMGNVPDVNIVGFNPQPEPPAEEMNFGLLLGTSIAGFNPQPEPPAIVTSFGEFSLNPTENGFQLINAEGVGVEVGLIDPEIGSLDGLTLWPFPNMPEMTLWSAEGENGGSTTVMCPGSEVSFNPQPEPPALGDCFSVTPLG